MFVIHGYPDWHRLYEQAKTKVKNKKITANVVSTYVSQDKHQAERAISKAGTAKSETDLIDKQCQQLPSMLQAKMQTHPLQAAWLSANSAFILYATQS